MIATFNTLGCRRSPKLHYSHSHLDFFSQNMAAISDEHGERFNQEIKTMEKRYAGKCTTTMIGDYILTLARSVNAAHRKNIRSRVHFEN